VKFWAHLKTGEILFRSRIPLFLLEVARQGQGSVQLFVDEMDDSSDILDDIDLVLDKPVLENELSGIVKAVAKQEFRTTG
jgi:hypothetical protein